MSNLLFQYFFSLLVFFSTERLFKQLLGIHTILHSTLKTLKLNLLYIFLTHASMTAQTWHRKDGIQYFWHCSGSAGLIIELNEKNI